MLKQLVQPNLTVTGQLGWCLQYADTVFGVSAVFPTAWDGWMQTDYPHNDRNLPNVAVPLWFDYWESGIRYGHVVVYVPSKGFYSSPWDRPTGYNILSSIESVEQHYGVTYVGWSEDISNVRVIKGEEDMDRQEVVDAYQIIRGADPSEAEIVSWVGKPSIALTRAFREEANASRQSWWTERDKLKKQVADGTGEFEQVTVYRKK